MILDKKLPRRTVLKGALGGLAAIPVIGVVMRADAAAPAAPAAPAGPAVKLDLNDPQAKALGYVLDTATVDAKTNPTHKPEQTCANCLQYQGKATDATAPCTIFAGKVVDAKGWCKVWAKKP